MPALTAKDLAAGLTGQADRSGGYVMQPSGFDPYEPGGVKSASPEVSGALVNGSSPGFHNAVCFENHQTDARTQEVDVAPLWVQRTTRRRRTTIRSSSCRLEA